MKETAISWSMSAVGLLCLVGIGVYLALLVWLGVSGVDKPAIQLSDSVPNEIRDNQRKVDVSQIQQWHLFGREETRKTVAPRKQEAPKTTLKLELLGVFLGQDGALSTAIIGEIGQSPSSYKEGDSIASGVTLKEVHSDKVILSRNGRYETLAFSESTGGGPDIKMPPARSNSERFSETRRRFLRRSASGNRANVTRNNANPAKSQLGRMVQSGTSYAPKEIISALQQDLEQNPESAIGDMGLVSTPGSSGYVIGANAPKDLLSTVGLRVGDRVMSVDGQSISGGSGDAALIQSAMQKNNVRVEVQRGTRTFTVNVPVPQ